MVRQIKILTQAQLCNFLNINVVRFSKDKKKRANAIGMGFVWLIVIAMMWLYLGAFSYGYIIMGLERVLPMYLILISSILIFFFGIMKAGSVIFQRNSYEVLCSLPVSQTAIVVSRFCSMYLGNMLLALTAMLPGMAVYGFLVRPGIYFYLWGFVGTLFIPLLPMTAATLLGALVTGISSRMKHKSLVSTGLTILLVIVIMMASPGLAGMEGESISEFMQNFSALSGMVTDLIEKLYPPAVWLGEAMLDGNLLQGILYFGVSILVFAVMVVLVATNFQSICQRLFSITAKHNYHMKELKKNSVLMALYKKEVKRYFSSSIYTTNTIVGPIMMVLLAGAVFFMGIEELEDMLAMGGGIVQYMPFALAATACVMTTTCTSISMEGKEWWIIKSMPITAKTVFDSKILLNLTLIIPFYIVSEILLMLALRPALIELLWLIVLPVIFIVFACVFGITVNLRFPVLEWENEVAVVKQSVSSLIGGLGGCAVIILCALPLVFVNQISSDLVRLIIAVVIAGITVFLYRKNAKVELATIG